MQRVSVESSALASVGYDASTGTLEVELRSGRVYRYFEVPPGIYERLLVAPSKGRFYNENVRQIFAVERVWSERTA